jgi:hypothetical protein
MESTNNQEPQKIYNIKPPSYEEVKIIQKKYLQQIKKKQVHYPQK